MWWCSTEPEGIGNYPGVQTVMEMMRLESAEVGPRCEPYGVRTGPFLDRCTPQTGPKTAELFSPRRVVHRNRGGITQHYLSVR